MPIHSMIQANNIVLQFFFWSKMKIANEYIIRIKKKSMNERK